MVKKYEYKNIFFVFQTVSTLICNSNEQDLIAFTSQQRFLFPLFLSQASFSQEAACKRSVMQRERVRDAPAAGHRKRTQ